MRLKVLLLVLSVVLLCSCSKKDIDATGTPNATEQQGTFQTQATAEVVDPSVAANELDIVVGAQQPVIPDILEPVASGLRVAQNDYVTIDYSNTQDGYVMVRFHAETSQKLKTQIIGTTTTYTYNLYPGEWAVFPLSDGNGHYQIKVFQNVSGSQYALVLAEGCDVVLVDEFAPFLRPNQYVNYSASSVAVKKAAELTEKISNLKLEEPPKTSTISPSDLKVGMTVQIAQDI